MTEEGLANLSNTEVCEYLRDASVRRAKCGFNAIAGNRILDEELMPACRTLAARGPQGMKALLSLLDDQDPNVRTDVAIFAYDSDPDRCREALKRARQEPGAVSMAALIGLLHRDPEFAAEFERQAKEDYNAEMVQRRRRETES